MANLREIGSIQELRVWEEGWIGDVRARKLPRSDEYVAEREILISAGFAERHWFPVAPMPGKRPGTTKRVFKYQTGQGRVCLTDLNLEGRWQVLLPISEEELGARAKERDAAAEREEYARALAEEQKELASMPTSHDDFRRRSARLAIKLMRSAVESVCGAHEYHGYAYAPEVLEDVDGRLEEIHELLTTGRTIFSKQRHEARIAAIKTQTAQADPGLRAFLERVSRAPAK